MLNSQLSLFRVLYGICVLVAGIYCLSRPLYNWDILPYSYLVLRLDHHNPHEAYAMTYQIGKAEIPAKQFHLLTDSENLYRQRMSGNFTEFEKQTPLYVIKPLYVTLSYLAYKCGVDLFRSTLVPSFVAYLLMAFILVQWLGAYLRPPVAFAIALSVMISSPLIEAAKLATPDDLSALLLLGAFYFVLKRPSLWLSLLCMILSVFTRLDNIITCLALLGTIYASRKWYHPISLTSLLTAVILLLCSYFSVTFASYSYGWSVFYYNDFVHRLGGALHSGNGFVMRVYFQLIYQALISGVNHSYLALFLVLLAFNFVDKTSVKRWSFDQLFLCLVVAIIVIRFVLFPDISDRFYIPFYLAITAISAKHFSSGNHEQSFQTV